MGTANGAAKASLKYGLLGGAANANLMGPAASSITTTGLAAGGKALFDKVTAPGEAPKPVKPPPPPDESAAYFRALARMQTDRELRKGTGTAAAYGKPTLGT